MSEANENTFRDRLKRLHDAHRRGRDTDDGPTGVYRADEESGEEIENRPAAGGWQGLGAVECTDYGQPIWIATERWPGDVVHGEWRVEQCFDVAYRELADLRVALPDDVERRQFLYMDTETTGLGEGSLAFMIGLGFWEGAEFVVEQLLIEEEGDEVALLQAFYERMADFDVLVTFNGKGFDVPLLARRYDRHGLESPLRDGDFHLDLLPLSRRIFPGLERYNLTNLEEKILGFERIDDVPGRQIPRRWWKFKKNRNSELMAGVLEHNRHDVVSMMVLVARALRGECPGEAEEMEETQKRRSGREQADRPTEGIANKLERAYRLRGRFAKKNRSDDSQWTQPDATSTPDDAVGGDAARRVAELRRGAENLIDQNMWREAFPLLCEMVALSPNDDWALRQLAEYYRREGKEALARELERRR